MGGGQIRSFYFELTRRFTYVALILLTKFDYAAPERLLAPEPWRAPSRHFRLGYEPYSGSGGMARPSTSSPSVRGSSSPLPRPPRIPSTSREVDFVFLADAQDPSSPCCAPTGILPASYHRLVFYTPFPALLYFIFCESTAASYATQRPGPHPAARPRQSTFPWPCRPPSPNSTHLLGGTPFRHHLSPLRGASSSSAASNGTRSAIGFEGRAIRPASIQWGRTILVSAPPQPRATTPVEHSSRDP
jgi:hypothetical protein